MTTTLKTVLAMAATTLVATGAHAHVGIFNLTTPISAGGQSSFAIANTTNEIQFAVPHGCTSGESQPAFTGANLDTYKIEVTVPAAIVAATTAASLRPSMEGLFGTVAVGAPDAAGNIKFTWTKKLAGATEQNFASSDNQLYKVSIRLKLPNVSSATDTTIKKYQFLTTQTCKSGTADTVLDWGTANSPKLMVFPDKRSGFNKYSLDASTAPDFATTATSNVSGALKNYFGDASIVWVGKAGYSANPTTATKIQALIAKDTSYSDLGARVGTPLTATDVIWVKY